jgi:hypothetical protein
MIGDRPPGDGLLGQDLRVVWLTGLLDGLDLAPAVRGADLTGLQQARLLALGAVRADVGQKSGEGFTVLADPEGQRVLRRR